MKKAIGLIAGALIITGCNGNPPSRTFWYQDGISFHQAQNAHAECEFKVGMNKIESVSERNNLVNSCMTMQGYRWGRYPSQ